MIYRKWINKLKSLPWVAWAAIYTTEIWLINLAAPSHFGWSLEERGTFGDMFGAANSLFAAFAVIGVAWSISMQRTELSYTREDRDRTKKILEDQQSNLKTQRFEATFFQLFTAFNGIIDAMEITYRIAKDKSSNMADTETDPSGEADLTAKGRDVLTRLLLELSYAYEAHRKWQEGKDPERLEGVDPEWPDSSLNIDYFQRAYGSLFWVYGDDLGRYFRSLYTILNFIHVSDIPMDQKPFYFKLLRAQLSNEESTLIALNYLTMFTTENFNNLTRSYGMAKNADRRYHVLDEVIHLLPDELFGRTFAGKMAAGKADTY